MKCIEVKRKEVKSRVHAVEDIVRMVGQHKEESRRCGVTWHITEHHSAAMHSETHK